MTTVDRDPDTRTRARQAFTAILWRDVFVSGRDFWVMLIQVTITPLFMLFVFAKVLGGQGYVRHGYADLLQPGIIALAAVMTALQTVAMPLVLEFGWTKEIEDRLLAPLPTALVAIEKMTIATLRGLFAATVMYPLGWLVMGSAPWNPAGLPLLVAMVLLGAWTGGGIGMTLAMSMPTNRINVAFSLIVTPLIFTGCVQYPWRALHTMPWFQTVTTLNPMTYCAEGVRAALVPRVPHLPVWLCLLVLAGTAAVFTVTGVRSFARRATR
jgi:ABC-2 type transport system permease protein